MLEPLDLGWKDRKAKELELENARKEEKLVEIKFAEIKKEIELYSKSIEE